VVATTRKDIEGTKRSILKDLQDVDGERLTVLEVDVTGKTRSHFRNPNPHLLIM